MINTKRLDEYKPSSINFEFRKYPFYWVMRLGNRYTHVMESRLKKLNMNITSWRIGLILRENGTLTMSEVAKHAVGRLPTITKSIYRMQNQGFVTVKQSDNDGRVTMVSITDQGLDTINQVIENTTKTIDRAFDGLSKSETDNLNATLCKILENLSDN
jgi:DNA-binding MarR family transcriptional regulator